MSATDRKSAWVPLTAIALLAACIWIGWSDFDPYVPRGVVQGTIRALPRDIVQLLVQYIIPALLVGFLARRSAGMGALPAEGVTVRQSRRRLRCARRQPLAPMDDPGAFLRAALPLVEAGNRANTAPLLTDGVVTAEYSPRPPTGSTGRRCSRRRR